MLDRIDEVERRWNQLCSRPNWGEVVLKRLVVRTVLIRDREEVAGIAAPAGAAPAMNAVSAPMSTKSARASREDRRVVLRVTSLLPFFSQRTAIRYDGSIG
jgi:hypothetical protein